MTRRTFLKATPTVEAEDTQSERYGAMVPDTLDLAERAAHVVNVLTGSADPEHNYETFLCAHLDARPPYFSRGFTGPCMQKPLEALTMMRTMSGSAQNAHFDEKMVDFVIRNIDKDGLWWMKAEGRPWQAQTLGGDQVWPVAQGRLISAMLAWHKYDRDEKWLRIAERLAGGLMKIALRANGRAWYHTSMKAAGGWGAGWCGDETPSATINLAAGAGPSSEEPSTEIFFNVGLPLRGLTEWYAVSGDEKALETAHQLARFMLKDSMWGGSRNRRQGAWRGHFHVFTMALMGLMEYGIAVDDAEVLELVRKAYEHGLSSGISRIGFFEAVRDRMVTPDGKGQCAECCGASDMLRIAIRLSEIGVGDYWEHADQYLRNHVVETQMIRRDLVEAVIAAGPLREPDPLMDDTNRVLERNIGCFASGSDPTWLYPWWTMCCQGNSAVGIYKGWESIIRCTGGTAQINLLLNRASPWLDVDSYLPYEGKVVLKNKTAAEAHVRIPSKADRKAVTCRVNDKALVPKWQGRYLVVETLAPQDEITIEFPMVETEERHTEKTYEQEYACRFKYNTLVDISPRGDRPRYTHMGSDDGMTNAINAGYPIYQRDCYKANKAPLRSKDRYVSQVII